MRPLEYGDRDHERAQPHEDGGMRRREALKYIAAGIGAGISGVFGRSEAEGATMDDVIAHKQAMETMAEGKRLVLDYDPSQEGEKMLAPSLVEPTKLNVEPVLITKTFSSGRPRIKTGIFLPTPQNVSVERNLAIDPVVYANDELVPPSEYNVELVYSEPCDQNPHRWAMTKFDIDLRARKVVVGTRNWMLLPEYDMFAMLQEKVQQQAQLLSRQRRMPYQQALQMVNQQVKNTMNQFGYDSPAEFADAAPILEKLSQPEYRQLQQRIFAGLSSASAIRYHEGTKAISPKFVMNTNHGDCGVKATRAALVANGPLEILVGCKRNPGDRFGGLHAVNYGLVDGSSFCADAHSNGNYRVNPTGSRMLATQIGRYANFDSSVDFHDEFNHTYVGLNGGAYNRGKYDTGRVSFSTVQGGDEDEVEWMREMAAKGADKAVQEYADFHRDQIKRHQK